jgi:hypothetical protein
VLGESRSKSFLPDERRHDPILVALLQRLVDHRASTFPRRARCSPAQPCWYWPADHKHALNVGEGFFQRRAVTQFYSKPTPIFGGIGGSRPLAKSDSESAGRMGGHILTNSGCWVFSQLRLRPLLWKPPSRFDDAFEAKLARLANTIPALGEQRFAGHDSADARDKPPRLPANPTLSAYGSFLVHFARKESNSGTRASGRFEACKFGRRNDRYGGSQPRHRATGSLSSPILASPVQCSAFRAIRSGSPRRGSR